MKTLLSSLALIATFAAAVPARAADSTLAIAYRVKSITAWENEVVTRDATRAEVLQKMGPPSIKLNDDTWAYHGYFADNLPLANQQGCRTMLVSFADGRVTDLRFVNKRAVRQIAAQLAEKPGSPLLAGK